MIKKLTALVFLALLAPVSYADGLQEDEIMINARQEMDLLDKRGTKALEYTLQKSALFASLTAVANNTQEIASPLEYTMLFREALMTNRMLTSLLYETKKTNQLLRQIAEKV